MIMASKTKKATAAEAADTNSAMGNSTAKIAPVLIKSAARLIPAIRVGARHVDALAECVSVQDAYRTSVTLVYNYETKMKAVTFGAYSEQIEINSHERKRVDDETGVYIKETFTIDTGKDMTNHDIFVTMINGEEVRGVVGQIK